MDLSINTLGQYLISFVNTVTPGGLSTLHDRLIEIMQLLKVGKPATRVTAEKRRGGCCVGRMHGGGSVGGGEGWGWGWGWGGLGSRKHRRQE